MKTRLKIGNIIIAFVLCLLLIFGGFKIYDVVFYEQNELKSLNYSGDFIKKAIDLDIASDVIEKNEYSKTIEVSVLNDSYDSKYFDTYYQIEYKDDENYIENVNKLLDLGYTVTDIDSLFTFLDTDSINKVTAKNYDSEIVDYAVFDFFNIDYLDRYKSYKEANNLDIETAIVYVNIGLDNEFYTSINTITNPSDLLVLVNKYNQLSSDYVPNDLKTIPSEYSRLENMQLHGTAYDKYMELASDMEAMGSSLVATSAYRSYDYQQTLYDDYVAADGVSEADTYSARAGHSEHQTGLAVDVRIDGYGGSNLVNADMYDWFSENIHKYGFIIRYAENTTDISGYMYEPWHIRYVGADVATKIYEMDITYDEYYVRYIQNK